jgi:hypothetical protein
VNLTKFIFLYGTISMSTANNTRGATDVSNEEEEGYIL